MKRSPIKFSNPMLKRCEFVTNEGFLQQISQADDKLHPVTIRIQPKIEITELSNFQYVASLQTVVGEKSDSCPFCGHDNAGNVRDRERCTRGY